MVGYLREMEGWSVLKTNSLCLCNFQRFVCRVCSEIHVCLCACMFDLCMVSCFVFCFLLISLCY